MTKNDPPSVSTAEVTEITFETATSGGNVLNDGGDPITARGICWSTAEKPTIEGSRTTEDGTLGSFVSILSQLTPDTRYYIRAYATNSIATGYGNEISFITTRASVPELTTADIGSIAQKTAISGGFIISDNGSSVVSRGVCWSITPNPTIEDSKSSSGSGSGEFSSLLTGLEANVTYYVRAYAINRTGTSYGNEIMFTTMNYGVLTDIVGNSYKTLFIGSQEWMAENLKTTSYSAGEAIPNITNEDEWSLQNEGAYCWYENSDVTYRDRYGALYNWFTVSDSRNVCPAGWHVPNDAEWTILTDFLVNNGYGYGGNGIDIAKTMAASSGWTINTIAGTVGNDQAANNSSGFTALPGGVRIRSGAFSLVEYTCSFWSTSEHSAVYGNALTLTGEFVNIFKGYTFKQDGASVRCLKDN